MQCISRVKAWPLRLVGLTVAVWTQAYPTLAQHHRFGQRLAPVAAPTDSSAPIDRTALVADTSSAQVDSASLLHRAPAFPGGESALLRFIRERLRYPALAARNRVEGKVTVSFWLDERGRPYGFGVLKGVGAGLDEEALRILREMPDWSPALINGQPALLQMRIPVVFRLAP